MWLANFSFATIQEQKTTKILSTWSKQGEKKTWNWQHLFFYTTGAQIQTANQWFPSLKKKPPQSEMSFSLSSSNTSSTAMKSHSKIQTFPLGPIKLSTQSESGTSH